jgi:chromosome segregation ATPase
MPQTFRKIIQEQIAEFQAGLTHEVEEERRLEEKICDLERVRSESFRKVAENNTNEEAQRRLDENDREMAILKAELALIKKNRQGRLSAIKGRMLHEQEKALAELSEQLESLHKEQDHYKKTLIPEQEQYLTRLRERLDQNEELIRHIHQEIAELNHVDLDKQLDASLG